MSSLPLLAILCWKAAAIPLISYYYVPYNSDPAQLLRNYVIDPVVIGALILVTIADTKISLEIHDAGHGLQHLPVDVTQWQC